MKAGEVAFVVGCSLVGFVLGALLAGELGLISVNPGPRLSAMMRDYGGRTVAL